MEPDPSNGIKSLSPSDALFTLLKRQAKEFETFGKRMSLDIQNSSKFYIQDQMKHELAKTLELDKILGKQQEQLVCQSHLIDSLRSRIKELENESITKCREIRRLKDEFLDFKKEIKTLLGLDETLSEEYDSDDFEFIHSDSKDTDSKSNQIVDIKKGDLTAITDNNTLPNDIKDDDFSHANLTASADEINGSNIKSDEKVSVLFDEYFYSNVESHGESSTSAISPNNKYSDNEMIDNCERKLSSAASKGKGIESDITIPAEDHVNKEDHQLEDDLDEDIKYNPRNHPSHDPNQNLNAAQKLRDILLDLKASELENNEPKNLQDDFNYVKKNSASQRKEVTSCLPPITIDPQVVNGPSSSPSALKKKPTSESRKQPTIVEKIEADIQSTIVQFQERNAKIKQKTFNYLLNQFTLESLIKYQRTNYYNVLARGPKRSIKLMVKSALRSELCNRDKRVTQPIEEYVKRKIIPSLPPGIKSYTEYEKTCHFVKLSDEKKKRIKKISTIEPKTNVRRNISLPGNNEVTSNILQVVQKPSVKLGKSYDFATVEQGWYDWWDQKGFFGSTNSDDRNSEKFIMLSPPPNVTGSLHIGHALTFSIQDALSRWYRMSGYRVSWIPGTDHAGIGTQSVVERKLLKEQNITRHDLGRENFVKEIWNWRKLHGDKIIQQLRCLGASLDWDNLFFTMDSPRSQAVTNAFIRLYNDGMIYRDTRLVNWCCALETVISDIEVDYETISKQTFLSLPGRVEKVEFGVIHKFAYPIADNGSSDLRELVVATTRIETMLGDTAVAVHPDDPRYKSLHGKYVMHPLLNKRIPIVCDPELVDMEFGTGAVKVTPGHDTNDFACARRHQLPIINIFNKNGTLNDNCGIISLINNDRFDVRNIIVDKLQSLGYYRGKDTNHEMRVAICSRSGDVIEQLLQPQWYLRCKDMAQRALQDVENGNIVIKPSHHIEEWNRWLGNIQDWCISRQLWWGHSVPAYHLSYEGQTSGNGLWFVAASMNEADQLVKEYFRQNNISLQTNYTLKRDDDVLDTWFSSALLPLSALKWNGGHEIPMNYPTTMIETGFDILFFWVSRMTMLCTYFSGKPPFKNILLHAMVRDSQGRKMSKSLGNVIDPLHVIYGITSKEMQQSLCDSNLTKSEIKKSASSLSKEFPEGIKACGTDSLRFSLVSYTQQTRQINLDISNVVSSRNFCNKIWNLFKFAHDRFDSLNHVVSLHKTASASSLCAYTEHLSLVDRYILSKMANTIVYAQNGFQKMALHEVTDTLRNFIVGNLCGVYLEFVKPVLYGNQGDVDYKAQKAALRVFEICLDNSLRLLHPFMPFITEELWQSLLNRSENKFLPESIMLAEYPKIADFSMWQDSKVEHDMQVVLNIIHASRSLRQENNIPSKSLPFIIWTSDQELINDQGPIKKNFKDIQKFIKASELKIIDSQDDSSLNNSAVSFVTSNLKVYVPMSSIYEIFLKENNISKDDKLKELNRKLDKVILELGLLKNRMEKPEYESKAPASAKKID
ncbi:745_t:CDS:10, partial [Funneliformis caledonium]